MTLRALRPQSLGDQIFERIGGDIIEGRYAPGEVLPPERELSQVLGVNRHVLREALKRLEQMRLVRIARGGRTSVRDFRRYAGLDLLEILAGHARAEEDVKGLWLAVLEMRVAVSADVARLCALRADDSTRRELVEIAAEMANTPDDAVLFRLEMGFWKCALDGASNLAYRLAFNSFGRAFGCVAGPAMHATAREIRESGGREGIAKAIARGDAKEAEALTREAMRRSAQRLEQGVLERPEDPANGSR